MIKDSVTWIITVNYRTAELVVKSLHALASQVAELNGGKVLVVDNASGDDSFNQITSKISSENWVKWAEVIPSERNGGFAFGNNIGFKLALSSSVDSDYLMLLNPDACVEPKAIEKLVEFMDAHPLVGIAGSQIKNLAGGIESSAHTFHSPISELLEGAQLGILSRYLSAYEVTPAFQNIAHQCDWVSGCSMIIRRKVIDDIGMMDEEFFLYFEEVDFFHRAAKAGWQTWYVPDSIVTHIEGAATGIKSKQRRPKYWFNSRRRYFVKHYGVKGLIAADILLSLGRLTFLIRRLFKIGAKNAKTNPNLFMFDLLSSDFKAMFSKKIWRI